MDCIFCEGKDTATVREVGLFSRGIWRVECECCGAMGQTHLYEESAATEWQLILGYKAALRDILHGPCASPGWNDRKLRELMEKTAHDALYGEDDTEHYGYALSAGNADVTVNQQIDTVVGTFIGVKIDRL